MKKRGLMGLSSVVGGAGLCIIIIGWAVEMSVPIGWWLLVFGLSGLISGTLWMKE